MQNKIFNIDTINKIDIENSLNIPYKKVSISTLGGKERASIIFHLSLDLPKDWYNGMYHNSRYYIFHLSYDGILENFSKGLNTVKIRKKTVKTLSEAIDYINKKLKG